MTPACSQCLDVTTHCVRAAETCAVCCGTSGNRERERCAQLARDCSDIGRLAELLMLRGSPTTGEACELHAVACDALAAECAHWPNEACCQEAMLAAQACAVACRSCSVRFAA